MDAPPSASPLTVIAEGQNAPTGATETVYRDAEAWAATRIEGTADPDFAREAVLLAAIDASTGGYRVRFDSVGMEGGEAVAHYTVEEPGPDCMTTQALTTPFQAVAVEGLPEGPVRFVQRRERYACE